MARRTYAQDQGIDTSALDELFLGILQSRRDQAGKLAALAAQDKLAQAREEKEQANRETIANQTYQRQLDLQGQQQVDTISSQEHQAGLRAKAAEDEAARKQLEADKNAANIISLYKQFGADPRIDQTAPPSVQLEQLKALVGEDAYKAGLVNMPVYNQSVRDQLVGKGIQAAADAQRANVALQNQAAVEQDVLSKLRQSTADLRGKRLSNEAAELSNAFTPVPLGASYVNMKPLEGRQLLMRTPGLAEQRTQTIDPKTGMPVESISPAVPGQMNLLPSVNAVRAAERATLMEGVNKAANKAFVGDITGLTNSLGDLPIVPATSQAAPQVVPSTAQRQPVGGLVGLGQQAARSISPYLYPEEPPVLSPLNMASDIPAVFGNLGAQALVGRSPFMMMTAPNMVKTVNGWIPASENLVDPRVRRPFSYR